MATTAKLSAALTGAALVAAAAVLAPVAQAKSPMWMGNYEVATDRWNDHSWIWVVAHSCSAWDCGTPLVDPVVNPETDDINVIGIPRPPKSQRIQNTAFLGPDGRYTLTVDVIDGVRCLGYNLPSHDVYNWDPKTLAGTITSTFNANCNGGPGGTNTYGFSLIRF